MGALVHMRFPWPRTVISWISSILFPHILITPEDSLHVCQLAPRSFQVGSSRDSRDSRTADAVLFFGPLYHLTDSEERLNALREAHRVLRAGGVLLAVAISRFASALDGIGRGLIRDPSSFKSWLIVRASSPEYLLPTTVNCFRSRRV